MSIPQITHARKAPPSVTGLPALLAEVFWLMRIVFLFRHRFTIKARGGQAQRGWSIHSLQGDQLRGSLAPPPASDA